MNLCEKNLRLKLEGINVEGLDKYIHIHMDYGKISIISLVFGKIIKDKVNKDSYPFIDYDTYDGCYVLHNEFCNPEAVSLKEKLYIKGFDISNFKMTYGKLKVEDELEVRGGSLISNKTINYILSNPTVDEVILTEIANEIEKVLK